MSNIVPFTFDTKEIRVVAQNKETWFVLRDLLDAMDSSTPVTVAVESIKQGLGDGFNNVIPILDSLGREQSAIIVSESAATYLLSRSNTEQGRKLNRFIHVEVLPSIRKTGSYSVVAPLPSIEVQVAEAAARMLRMSETSKIRMLSAICKQQGGNPAFLPSYVQEELVRSLTALLDEHGSSLSARLANLALIDMGLLEELTRTSTSGQTKKFKSLTDAGLVYGRNETSPNNPRETQPLYYVSKFQTLLTKIEEHLSTNEE